MPDWVALTRIRQRCRRIRGARASQAFWFKPVVFLHIPKTGGTSLTEALLVMRYWTHTLTDQGNITPDLLRIYSSFPAEEQSRTLIYGHADHGVFRAFTNATLLTIVRDPEEQAVSNYLHILRSPDTPLYREAHLLTFSDFLRTHWQCLVFQNISLVVPNSTRPIGTREEFFSYLPVIRGVLNRIDFVGTSDNLSGFLTTLCCAYGLREPTLHHLHRAIDLGATTQQIAELRRLYRTVTEEPLLAHLVAEERALYQTALRKAQAMQRKYRQGNSRRWIKQRGDSLVQPLS
jgi:hypothetical protein